jgi:F0F1-type ATP synthase epsilon subunit
MKVKIAAPQEILFDGEAVEIVLPGYDGEFTVMDFHQSCLYSLRQGRIKLKFKDKEKEVVRFTIKSGLAHVDFNGLNLAVEPY